MGRFANAKNVNYCEASQDQQLHTKKQAHNHSKCLFTCTLDLSHALYMHTCTQAHAKEAKHRSVRVEEKLARAKQKQPALFAVLVQWSADLSSKFHHTHVGDQVVAQVHELHVLALW